MMNRGQLPINQGCTRPCIPCTPINVIYTITIVDYINIIVDCEIILERLKLSVESEKGICGVEGNKKAKDFKKLGVLGTGTYYRCFFIKYFIIMYMLLY